MLTLPHMRPRILVFVVALGGLLSACQSPDVGQDCTFRQPVDPTLPVEYVETGNTACDNLVCIKSPGRSSAYCSKPCVSNADCFQSQTNLLCRALTFDQSFFDSNPDLKAQYQPYLGAIGLSTYCATPQQ